tara:strand:- start:61 stop:312 length:252 start_codon:yes stop_codon:yes gene_type:complete
MESVVPIIAAILAGLVALFFGKKSLKKKSKSSSTPPKNLTADASRQTIQQTFEEQVSQIKKDTESKNPAQALADRGNARKRRK